MGSQLSSSKKRKEKNTLCSVCCLNAFLLLGRIWLLTKMHFTSYSGFQPFFYRAQMGKSSQLLSVFSCKIKLPYVSQITREINLSICFCGLASVDIIEDMFAAHMASGILRGQGCSLFWCRRGKNLSSSAMIFLQICRSKIIPDLLS